MTDNHQDQWPKCIHFDLCGGRIYLDPENRTVCAACEQRGGPPPKAPARVEGRTDEDRVKESLAKDTPQERRRRIANLENFNATMAEQWRGWLAELEADEAESR